MYIFDAISAISLFAIAYLLLFAVFNQRRAERKTQMQYAASFVQKWTSAEFLAITQTLFSSDNRKILAMLMHGDRDVLTQSDKRVLDAAISLLSFFEEMALSIEYRLSYEPILRRYFAQTARDIFKSCEGLIHLYREEHNNKTLFVNFERLIGRWSFVDDHKFYGGGAE